MTRPSTILLAALASLGTTTVPPSPVNIPHTYRTDDYCDEGATEADLANILRQYNQPTDPTHIYDSVYTCFKQNSVGWVQWCGGPYTCQPTSSWPLAGCK
ncbi:hypothetical protein QBC46DRAFT_462625 [Diplogelasinospora grovesii]|uniref:Uncharacterized protein n=1 Tax=Diplogelasinospora grovesii TaxID=303347 RepID=A0AAN6MXS3_9PEZI|nr:hypothetical protein QBC46DRAFT_462625 [Diplogelasinospora grovesii]